MSVEAVFGWGVIVLLAAVGGLATLMIAHIKECGDKGSGIGSLETKVDNLDDEVTKLRRVCHRHTSSIGRLNYKTGINDEDRDLT